ncbi:MAG: TetR/AcrR family transcriptional regulator [Pseudomonadota bacterium]
MVARFNGDRALSPLAKKEYVYIVFCMMEKTTNQSKISRRDRDADHSRAERGSTDRISADALKPGKKNGDPSETGRQVAKSTEMRRRIHEGATAVLAEVGYHRTSIIRVVERCSITSGALQHHFPTKLELMGSTADFLLRKSVRWFSEIKFKWEDKPDALQAGILRSWQEQHKTDDYSALLEILIAARTDAPLKERIAPAWETWANAMDQELAKLYPNPEERAKINQRITMGRALMVGLLVQDELFGDEALIEEILSAWHRLVTQDMP